jgi:AraC-like DNA-binding protein
MLVARSSLVRPDNADGLADRQAGRRNDLTSTIAYEAGFSDLSCFQRCFRKAFGASPRAAVNGLLDMPVDSFDTDGS